MSPKDFSTQESKTLQQVVRSERERLDVATKAFSSVHLRQQAKTLEKIEKKLSGKK